VSVGSVGIDILVYLSLFVNGFIKQPLLQRLPSKAGVYCSNRSWCTPRATKVGQDGRALEHPWKPAVAMGKSWENPGKILGKSWENPGKKWNKSWQSPKKSGSGGLLGKFIELK